MLSDSETARNTLGLRGSAETTNGQAVASGKPPQAIQDFGCDGRRCPMPGLTVQGGKFSGLNIVRVMRRCS